MGKEAGLGQRETGQDGAGQTKASGNSTPELGCLSGLSQAEGGHRPLYPCMGQARDDGAPRERVSPRTKQVFSTETILSEGLRAEGQLE